jgi:hypothetical protein
VVSGIFLSIEIGKTTSVLSSTSVSDDMCFSLISAGRTVDLECDSAVVRNWWVRNARRLIEKLQDVDPDVAAAAVSPVSSASASASAASSAAAASAATAADASAVPTTSSATAEGPAPTGSLVSSTQSPVVTHTATRGPEPAAASASASASSSSQAPPPGSAASSSRASAITTGGSAQPGGIVDVDIAVALARAWVVGSESFAALRTRVCNRRRVVWLLFADGFPLLLSSFSPLPFFSLIFLSWLLFIINVLIFCLPTASDSVPPSPSTTPVNAVTDDERPEVVEYRRFLKECDTGFLLTKHGRKGWPKTRRIKFAVTNDAGTRADDGRWRRFHWHTFANETMTASENNAARVVCVWLFCCFSRSHTLDTYTHMNVHLCTQTYVRAFAITLACGFRHNLLFDSRLTFLLFCVFSPVHLNLALCSL